MALKWLNLDTVHVPARPQGLWTLVQEYVPGGRLLRATVVPPDPEKHPSPKPWSPEEGTLCGPDGMVPQAARVNLLCTTALVGALIGKIGGGTADLPDSTPGTTTPYGNKKVFAVGSDLILPLGPSDGGALFLTMNDNAEGFSGHSGELFVQLQYYPT